MFQQIGYPDFITNTTLLEEYFSGVSIEIILTVLTYKIYYQSFDVYNNVLK